MKGIILLFIRSYQKYFSPLFPRSCRFYPTCSEYVFKAVQQFGVKKGLVLGLKRIIRCNPFNNGGYDPLPKQ